MSFDKNELTKMREFLLVLCKRRGQAKKPVVEMVDLCQNKLFDKLPTRTEKYKMLEALREALPAFARRLPGYDHPDAVLTGVETRTSSPVRIPRDQQMESLNTHGLFPAGEGAGYAGGILSAGIDGIRAAEAAAQQLQLLQSSD